MRTWPRCPATMARWQCERPRGHSRVPAWFRHWWDFTVKRRTGTTNAHLNLEDGGSTLWWP